MFTPDYAAIPAGAIAIVAEITARPGQEDALRAATLPLIARVRNEPENILYFLHEDLQSPGHFTFYEIFGNEAAFEAHNQTSHVQDWFRQLPDLAEGSVAVTRMKILG